MILLTFGCFIGCAATTGSLEVWSLPSGTNFSLRSQTEGLLVAEGVTPALIKLTPGDYIVTLSLGAAYETVVQRVSIQKNEVKKLERIELRLKLGHLRVSSAPKGAKISVTNSKGKVLSEGKRTPASFSLPPGAYTVRLSLGTAYETITRTVEIQPGVETRLEGIEMPLVLGSLQITTKPTDAQVQINGKTIRNRTKPLLVKELTPGAHRIRVTHEKYLPKEKKVQVVSGEVTFVTIQLEPKFGHLVISSVPKGAQITISPPKGEVPLEGKRTPALFSLPTGEYTVQLSLGAAYDSITRVFQIQASMETILEGIELPLKLGSLRITTEPKEVQVRIDGIITVKKGKAPLLVDKLTPGGHRIWVTHKKYLPKEETVQVRAGGVTPVTIQLEPKVGSLVVSSVPKGARISVTNQTGEVSIGEKLTPTSLTLPPGVYTVQLSLDSAYEPITRTVHIQPGKETQLERIVLPLKLGGLRITTEPKDAQVQVDGKTVLSKKQPLRVEELSPGIHRIRVTHPKYLQKTETVKVVGDVETSIRIQLEPKFGNLVIHSKPQGAKIVVTAQTGTVAIGEKLTPAHIKLPAGEYTVTLERGTFYEPAVRTVSITEGQQIELKGITLTPLLPQDKFVHIPAGWFDMGSERTKAKGVRPVHRVYLDEYWIGRYEVTVKEYEEFVQDTGYAFPVKDEPKSNWGKTDREDHPINFVSWNDAKKYVQWLSNKTGLKYQLSTEAQWEKAARFPDGRIYPWGNNSTDGARANHCDQKCKNTFSDAHPAEYATSFDDGYATTAPVGSYENGKSASGVYDMAGNVWEWVEDAYDETFYQKSPEQNPLNTLENDFRVVRGGSWESIPGYLRSYIRFRLSKDERKADVGFRVVVLPE